MSTFVPHLFYGIDEQCGPGKMFGSRPARDAAVKQGLLDPGFLIGNRRKNTGQQLNDCLTRCQTTKALPEGFGGAQPNAGRRKPDTPTAA
jgi:hypothetical protein